MIPTWYHIRLLLKTLAIMTGLLIVFLLGLLWFVRAGFDGTAALPADCGLVFGAAVHSVGSPGPGITRRVEEAVVLYQDGKISTLILSGGRGSDTQESEAAVMRKVALLHGVDPDDIVLEEEATSTWENLINSRPLTGSCTTVVGISDRYHLARIDFLAWLQGWGDLTTHPAGERAAFPFEIRSIAREALAIVYNILRDYFGMNLTSELASIRYIEPKSYIPIVSSATLT